jgi:hypothetical protein
MQRLLNRANEFFDTTLTWRSRITIMIAILLMIPVFYLPLWTMSLYSNQFPDGLILNIFPHKLEGHKSPIRDDLKEINSLNHYIGMRALAEEDFTEFKWIPFVLGAIVLLGLRAAVLGKMSKLIDLVVLMSYFGLFSLWSFYHKLYLYGHHLDPTAAVKVDPFTPPLFGHQTMANFEVFNYPAAGTYFMIVVPVLLAAAIWFSMPKSR